MDNGSWITALNLGKNGPKSTALD